MRSLAITAKAIAFHLPQPGLFGFIHLMSHIAAVFKSKYKTTKE